MDRILGLIKKFENLFDQTFNDVPTNRRFGAYVADWAIGGIFSGIPAVLIYAGVTRNSDMFTNLYVFEALGYERYWGIIAGAFCILFALFYYVYVPWKIYPGQTVGKKIAGLRIERVDGEKAGLKELLLRQAFAIFLLEGSVFIISGYIRQTVTLLSRFYVDIYWQYASIAITFVSVIMIVNTRSHRGLHDYIAKTRVVMASAIQEDVKPIKKAVPVQPKEEKKKAKPASSAPAAKEKQRLPKKNKPKK